MKMNKLSLFFKIAVILGSVVEVALIAACGYFLLMLCDNMLYFVSEHVNVILGMVIMCGLFFYIITFTGRPECDERDETAINTYKSIYRR